MVFVTETLDFTRSHNLFTGASLADKTRNSIKSFK